MDDWTAWQVVTLVGIVCAGAVGLAWVAAWYLLARRRAESALLGPDDRAARALGEIVARCDGAIETETVNELFRVFARTKSEHKRAIVEALQGLLVTARDGPHNLDDLDGRLVSMARQLSHLPSPEGDAPSSLAAAVRV